MSFLESMRNFSFGCMNLSLNHIHGWNDVKSIRELLEINNKIIDKIFNEILERKGLDDHLGLGDKLDLLTLNKNLFKRTQDERDDIFLKIVGKCSMRKSIQHH